MQFTLIYRKSGTSLTIGAGPGNGRKKNEMSTIFRLDIAVGNFGLPLKVFRLFWKFSSWANQNRFTIYSTTEMSGICFFFFFFCKW